MSDPIIQRIERFRCRRGRRLAERRNRGYTLYRDGSGAPVARLCPTGQKRRAIRAHYAAARREALRFIASEDIV